MLVLLSGVAIVAGVGGLGVLDDGGDVTTETPTAPDGQGPANGDGGDGAIEDGSGADEGDGTPTPPPLGLVVESVEPCGETCRDVTATLVNNQDRQATGVTVDTSIYAGEGTEGDVVWEGSRDIGTLGPGESETDTTRVELGFLEAARVQSAGGVVTIETVVETDRQTVEFVERRDVS